MEDIKLAHYRLFL